MLKISLKRNLILKVSILFILVNFLIVGCSSNKITSFSKDEIILSDLTEEECIEFIKNNDIEIPEDFRTDANLGKFIKETIKEIEDNQELAGITISYTVTKEFVEDIKDVVLTYYEN